MPLPGLYAAASFHCQHQSCNYRALPSACAGQPSRPRYVPLRSVTPDCSGSSRGQALAETHFRPPALPSRPLTWKARRAMLLAQPDRRGGGFCRAPWHRQVGVPHRCAPSRDRQKATPPRRILALCRAGFSRGSTAPGDANDPRQQAVKQALFFPRSSRLNNRQGLPKCLLAVRSAKP